MWVAIGAALVTRGAALGEDEFRVKSILVPGPPMAVATTDVLLEHEVEYTLIGVYWMIEVTKESDNSVYYVLVGPNVCEQRAQFMIEPYGPPDCQRQEIVIYEGAGFFSQEAYGGTGGGTHTSDGTKVVVQTGSTYDRFFLLDGDDMKVFARGDTGTKKNTSRLFYYIDVANGTVAPPTRVRSAADRALIWKLIEYAYATGIP
jgi:hypothetical protein